jgi:hypothetical protein
MRDRWFLTLGIALLGVAAVMCIWLLLRMALDGEEKKPECVCKAEACPTCPEKANEPQTECPPQPVREVFRPLSEELDVALAACKPAVEQATATIDEALAAGYAALDAAKQAGADARDFSWLDQEGARKAVADLLVAREVAEKAADALWDALRGCRSNLDAVVADLSAFQWMDADERDAGMARSRQFEEDVHRVIGYELDRVWCNVAARRMECPLPKPGEELEGD